MKIDIMMLRMIALSGLGIAGLMGCPEVEKTDSGEVQDTGEADADTDTDADTDSDTDTDTDDTGTPAGVTIEDVQTGLIGSGETVTLKGVIVSSPKTPTNTGFFISDARGGEYSGLWVYTSFDPTIEVEQGQVLTITGTVGEYSADAGGDTGAPELADTETQTQLAIASSDAFEVTGEAELPLATVIDGATLADAVTAEPYEGVVVQLEEVTVLSHYLSGQFTVTGGALVSDLFYDADYVRLGDGFGRVSGPVYFADGTYMIEPRSSSDLSGYLDTCSSCGADKCIGDLVEGELAITELMIDPLFCADSDCEYIEVYNASGVSVDLNCLTLNDGSDHVGYVEGTLEVAADSFAVLTRRSSEPGYGISGVNQSDYRRAMSLNNDFDTITLSYGETVLDVVAYNTSAEAGWPGGTPGRAMVLSLADADSATTNNDPASWCEAFEFIGSTGDYGSPGVASFSVCP